LTLLLTFLSASEHKELITYVIPLPSRLQIADGSALGLQNAGGYWGEKCDWKIFHDFLDSGDPLALDQRRYAIASFACLKILFGFFGSPFCALHGLADTLVLSGWIWMTISNGTTQISQWELTGGEAFVYIGT